MKALITKPGVDQLISGWHSAKEAEKSWAEHRRQIEVMIAEQYGVEVSEVTALLEQGTALSETLKVADLKISVGRTLSIEQAGAALFCAANPALVNVLFKFTYAAANSAAVLGAMHQDGPLGEEIRKIVEIKPSKPSFSKA